MSLEEIEELKRQEALTEELRLALQRYFSGLEAGLLRLKAIPEPQKLAEEILKRTPRLTGTLDRGIERAMRRGILQMAEQFGDEAILNPRSFAVRRSIEQAQYMNETTAKQLSRWRKRAQERPASWARRTLRELFDIHSKRRAELIATHETFLGHETGRQMAAYSLSTHNIVVQKHWYNQGDDRVTDECIANQRAGWINYGATFPAGKNHPPQHYNCRCWIRYREHQLGEQVPSARRARRLIGGPDIIHSQHA